MKPYRVLALSTMAFVVVLAGRVLTQQIGQEMSVPQHLRDGEEFRTPLGELLAHGARLFSANWTSQEGGGRPLTKGNGNPLADPTSPLIGPRGFNRVSAPDANSCAGCHNSPFGLAGGGGDIVANVFVLGQRFDFATFDGFDGVPTRGTANEIGLAANLQTVGNSRATLGMFGSGYIEMLARQMTTDLQAIRDGTPPGGANALMTKGISFGTIARAVDGSWVTSGVEGLPAASLATAGAANPPSLIIRPFHQVGNVVSLRQFSNNAFNHHHGIQSTERFGISTDPDGDGFVNEMSRADVTAVSLFQATMAVPGRVIPNDPDIEAAVLLGEQRFASVGCTSCHVSSLPLTNQGWIYSEPNPFNPAGNLRPGDAPALEVNLTRADLPTPRLTPMAGVVHVPAFTDLKLHNLCDGPDDPNFEALDMHQPAGSPNFFAGNGSFITRKLWGVANEPPYFHHGQFTTMRDAVLAHRGEANAVRQAYLVLPSQEQDAVIEFLKTLQVLRPGATALIVDEKGVPKKWPRKPKK
jgi:cytochrome c peroxidase